jgi:hypothetical protein
MKLLITSIILLITGCSSELRIAKFANTLTTSPVSSVCLMRLPPSAYTSNHNIPMLRNKDFSNIAQLALESAIAKKKKGWNMVYSANIDAIEPSLADTIANYKDKSSDFTNPAVINMMANAASVLKCSHLVILESISIKDASSAQAPSLVQFGAWVQIIDMRNGQLAYRARNVSRPVSYAEKDFDDRMSVVLFDLFAETIKPLPKSR